MLIYRNPPIRNTGARYIRKRKAVFSYIRKILYIQAVSIIPIQKSIVLPIQRNTGERAIFPIYKRIQSGQNTKEKCIDKKVLFLLQEKHYMQGKAGQELKKRKVSLIPIQAKYPLYKENTYNNVYIKEISYIARVKCHCQI